MANSALLRSMDKRAINEFRKDLLGMLRVGKELDRHYGESNLDVMDDIKKFDSLIKSFNKKYKNLMLRLVKKTDSIELKLLLNEKSARDAFENSASKIIGLQSVGASGFGTAIVSDSEGFSAELGKIKDKLCVTYYNPQTGTSKVFLQYDKKSKKIELVYELEEIEIEPSAEFQIAAYYALNEEYNKKIKLANEAATLGFPFIPDHNVRSDYFHKFDPDISE
ncbi:hypothetical protein CMO93_06060 [Candidatus Woesearchaeota archaeon]|nr:hypothetical protein [Candidatus Woesearchaeota archaeon]|tara:strand:- start:8809 stop:9474 length:666 start_codon:yes stop_codon:yes gene_type:complete